MQSIFRPASRREALGEHSGGDRRDGGLKMLCIPVLCCKLFYAAPPTKIAEISGGRGG